jgi:hypothetical protein
VLRNCGLAWVRCWLAWIVLSGCQRHTEQGTSPKPLPPTLAEIENIQPQIATFCGDCHALPHPETFPKAAWQREVERGFSFYDESGRKDLVVPPIEAVVGYYEALAPVQLSVPPPDRNSSGIGSMQFRVTSSESPEFEPPAVSFIEWLHLPNQDRERLVFCDMRSGLVGVAAPSPQGFSVQSLTNLNNPSRIALGDLDGDGQHEILIADLGSFTSEDHRRGGIVWLQWDRARNAWRQRLLVSGLGRVADVRVGDFDGDGDADLVAAEFGHLRTGRVLLYENLGIQRGMPNLREHVIDPRHGAIHVPVADLNGDGRLDFVALISQEYEVIEAYINSGDGKFERQTVFAAGDPAYGSSGIELVDLDRDGDLDVLYSNGDTFGSDYLKPYHGIRWLENQGSYPFVEHPLTQMIGVQRAVAVDLDDDQDLDIAAIGFLPQNLVANPELTKHDSLIWLEQQQPGIFVRHSLESGRYVHAALSVGDFDQDGHIDLAAGSFQDLRGPHEPWFKVWWNAAKRGNARVDN